jgi:LysR family transcriptional regulator, regulator for metE and metH
MKNLELQHLRLIKHIVDEGSMTSATKKMFLTQSALSHMLKDMETSMGAEVFTRRNKKLYLTDMGKALLFHGERMLTEFAELEKKIAAIKADKKERVRISTGCYTSYNWLPAVIKTFKKQNIAITIEIVTEATGNPLVYLEDGRIDIAISDGRPSLPPGYQLDLLFEDEFVLVVSKNSKYADLKKVNAHQLNGEDLLIYDMDERNSTALNHFIKPNKVQLNSITKMQLTEGIIEMVAADLGVTIMPAWIALPYLKQQKVISIKLSSESLRRKWYAASFKEASPAVKMLITLLQHELPNKYGREN